MFRLIFGIFTILHGLVHLFYAGHARRLFELRPEMTWPDGSWAFSRLLGIKATRTLAIIGYVLVTAGFVIGGGGILFAQAWWRPIVLTSAAVSSAIIILFWDGKRRMLADQGGVGLLINVAMLVALLFLQWPDLGF